MNRGRSLQNAGPSALRFSARSSTSVATPSSTVQLRAPRRSVDRSPCAASSVGDKPTTGRGVARGPPVHCRAPAPSPTTTCDTPHRRRASSSTSRRGAREQRAAALDAFRQTGCPTSPTTCGATPRSTCSSWTRSSSPRPVAAAPRRDAIGGRSARRGHHRRRGRASSASTSTSSTRGLDVRRRRAPRGPRRARRGRTTPSPRSTSRSPRDRSSSTSRRTPSIDEPVVLLVECPEGASFPRVLVRVADGGSVRILEHVTGARRDARRRRRRVPRRRRREPRGLHGPVARR